MGGHFMYIGGKNFIFSMTADYHTPGAANRGYVNVSAGSTGLANSFGSISNEPIGSSNRLARLTAGAGTPSGSTPGPISMIFEGDIVALLTDLLIYIDGVAYTPTTPWGLSGGLTRAEVSGSHLFNIGQTYQIQLRM